MTGWKAKSGLVVGVFVTAWTVAIMYWRGSGSVPTGLDLLLYLGLLPAGLSGAGFMVNGWARQGADRLLQQAVAEQDKGASDGAGTVTGTESSALRPSADLLSGQINLGSDMNAQALLASVASPPRPPLNSRFRDEQNLPIRMCVSEALDEFAVVSEREQGIDTTACERRALALLVPLLDELLADTATALPVIKAGEEVVIAGLRRRDETRVDTVLTVELLVPRAWSGPLQHWAADWLSRRVEEAGIDARRFDVKVTLADGALEVWKRVGEIADGMSDSVPRWHLLLACASFTDQSVVQLWQNDRTLATARNPEGKVPGEGAAGILFGAVGGQSPSTCLWKPCVLADEYAGAARPADRLRRLLASVSEWKQSLGDHAAGVQFVLHDGSRSNDTTMEAAMIAATVNPDCDFGSANLSLPSCAGELGPVLPVAQLVVALERTQQSADPVLALGGLGAQHHVLTLVGVSSSQAADQPPAT